MNFKKNKKRTPLHFSYMEVKRLHNHARTTEKYFGHFKTFVLSIDIKFLSIHVVANSVFVINKKRGKKKYPMKKLTYMLVEPKNNH